MKKLLLVLSVTLSLTAVAQNGNKLRFQKGQKLEIVTETKKNSTMELMGQSMENIVSSTITESFDIEDVNESGATIEYKVKRLLIDANAMGRAETFDSEKEGDRKGEMGKLLEKGLKNKFTMKVDNSGKIISIKADDDNPNAGKTSAEDEAMAAMISMQLGIPMGMPKEGDNSIFKILPDKPVAQGDTWTVALDSNGQKKSTVYKVASISDDGIVLDYTEEITINTKQQMMGTEANVTGTEKSTGQITLDKSSGLLKSKTITKEAKANIEAQGMSLPTTEKTSVTVTVKTI